MYFEKKSNNRFNRISPLASFLQLVPREEKRLNLSGKNNAKPAARAGLTG